MNATRLLILSVLIWSFASCQMETDRTRDLARPAPGPVQVQSLGLSPVVPTDLLPRPGREDEDASEFAWRSFVALNWPALAGSRGIADPNKIIGQPGPVVWETWKSPWEIFYSDGKPPPGWEQYGGLPAACKPAASTSNLFVLARTSKVPAGSDNDAVRRAKQAVGGTLTDQHGNLARYEIRMNKTIFDEIVAKGYFNVNGQEKAPVILFPDGVMEVKAAWREMTAADSAEVKGRFYRRKAWIYTPASGGTTDTCVEKEVGLVGLHIAQKTKSRPQWIWATFEQVDNVPPFESGLPSGRTLPYSFNNPQCPPAQCPPNRSTEKNGEPTKVPTQVTRVVNIGDAAQTINPIWQQKLAQAAAGSPFQYYDLIDVQWPRTPARKPVGDPTPVQVANTAMETYVADSSCIKCHFTARTRTGKLSSDYSFTLAGAHAQ